MKPTLEDAILKALYSYRNQALSATALAGSVGTTPPVSQPAAARLVQRGLVESDSEHTLYRLTDAGFRHLQLNAPSY